MYPLQPEAKLFRALTLEKSPGTPSSMVCTSWRFTRLVGVLVLIGLTIIVGCESPSTRSSTRPALTRALTPLEPPRVVPTGVTLESPTGDELSIRPPRHVLALSSGGLYGAYSSGFLAGWSDSGTRPEFDVVTGVSTGALIAPLAFLGSEFDDRMQKLYTGIRAEDVFKIRAWVTIPFKDAVASSAPLRKLIESQVTPELDGARRGEHKKGRWPTWERPTSARADSSSGIWEKCARLCPEGCHLFRDIARVVLGTWHDAAGSVRLEAEGKTTPMHCDGGVSSQIFVPPVVQSRGPVDPTILAVAPLYARSLATCIPTRRR